MAAGSSGARPQPATRHTKGACPTDVNASATPCSAYCGTSQYAERGMTQPQAAVASLRCCSTKTAMREATSHQVLCPFSCLGVNACSSSLQKALRPASSYTAHEDKDLLLLISYSGFGSALKKVDDTN